MLSLVAHAGDGRLGGAVRDVLEDVEARDPVLGEQAGGFGVRLLENRGADVARLHLLALGALDVEHGGLQHAAERRRLLRLALVPAADFFNRFVEVRIQLAPQPGQVRAAGAQDLLAVGIVRERVEQVLERQVRVPPRDRLAVGDGQHDFERR